jgi:hypothetical protein
LAAKGETVAAKDSNPATQNRTCDDNQAISHGRSG